MTVTKGDKTMTTNNIVNTFIERKRLRLSDTMCSRIHIGGGHENCPIVKVHSKHMKESDSEKYMGDYI